MDATQAVVVVGGSAGAIDALLTILPGVPAALAPIIIVIHRPPQTSPLARVLGLHAHGAVVEPGHGELLRPGRLYLASSDHHLMIVDDHFALGEGAPVWFSRPSIDVLFTSAAAAYGARVVAVILTGSNLDGVDGACQVKRCGGQVIVQDPGEALFATLPAAVIARGCADRVASMRQIAEHIVAACARVAEGQALSLAGPS